MNPQPPTLDELQSIADSLRGANLRARSQVDMEVQLDRMIHSHEHFGITRSVGQTWYRARPAPYIHGFSNISELIHRKDGSPTYGRASLPNQPVLYASWNLLTALEEVRSEPGQFIQLISLRVRNGMEFPCDVLGECHSVFHSGGSLINSRSLEQGIRHWMGQPGARVFENVFVDAFLSEEFSRRAEYHTEYKLTATYAQRMLQRKRGLMFPSVQAHQNINLAIAASDFLANFEVMGSLLVQIKQYAGYGLFTYLPIKQTHTLDKAGNFVWDPSSDISYETGRFGGTILDPLREGWRASDA